MSNLKDFQCVKIAESKNKNCEEKQCRHWIECSKSLNCSIIAAETGPMTLQNIGDFYGISRMRVCQIEKALLEKLRSSQILSDFDPSS